jgi:hypothetical protein
MGAVLLLAPVAHAGRAQKTTPVVCAGPTCAPGTRELPGDVVLLLQSEMQLASLALHRSRTALVLHVATRTLSSYGSLLPRLHARASDTTSSGARDAVRAMDLARERLVGLQGAAFDVEYLGPFAHRQRHLLLALQGARRGRWLSRETALLLDAALSSCRQELALGERILSRMMVPSISALE